MKKILAMGVFLSIAITAQAGDKLGGYIGGGAGLGNSAVAKDYGEQFFDSTSKKDSSASAYKVFAGYEQKNWGVELAYYSFGTYKTNGSINFYYAYDAAAEFSANAMSAAAVGKLPLSQELMLTGKFGVASAKTEYKCIEFCSKNGMTVSKTSVVPLLGLGAQYKVSDEFALNAEWEIIGDAKVSDGYNSAKYSFNMLSISAQYSF